MSFFRRLNRRRLLIVTASFLRGWRRERGRIVANRPLRSTLLNGFGEAALAEAGWYEGNANGTTHPVGQKRRNTFDLFDMHGNVWEWCRDAWDEFAFAKREDGVSDPEVTKGDVSGEYLFRVLRGGSWGNSAW